MCVGYLESFAAYEIAFVNRLIFLEILFIRLFLNGCKMLKIVKLKTFFSNHHVNTTIPNKTLPMHK